MKILKIIIFLVAVMSVVLVANGCGSHKLTEPEARIRAVDKFERHCRGTIHYETNEFNGPQLDIGTDNRNEVVYAYTWKHKSENLLVSFGVSESGLIGGGSSPIDHDKPLPPRRTKRETGQ
jgi:hypothetical protein